MSRPITSGIHYFPLDVDFSSDRKFRRIRREFGLLAHAAVPALWRIAYKENGYYLDWSEDVCYDLSEELGCEESELMRLVENCLKVGLFDAGMYKEYGILTSVGIQRRYDMIRKESKRRHRIDEKHTLLTVYDEENTPASERKPEGRDKNDATGSGMNEAAKMPPEITTPIPEETYPKQEITTGNGEITAPVPEETYLKQEITTGNREITTLIPEETYLKQEITTGIREITTEIPEVMPQSKVNESKGKENKIIPSPLPPPEEGGLREGGTSPISMIGIPLEIPPYALNAHTHNLPGLIERLRYLRVTSGDELAAILRLTDFGRKHTPVWSIVSVNNWPEAQNKASPRFRQIARPGQYILKVLSNERERRK